MILITVIKEGLLLSSLRIRGGAYGKANQKSMLGRQIARQDQGDLGPCRLTAQEAHGDNQDKERDINRPS